MALFDSKLEQSFEYAAEPAVVAQACQDAIELIGLIIKNASRETGLITARTPLFGFGGDKFMVLKISKSEKGATVSVPSLLPRAYFQQAQDRNLECTPCVRQIF